MHKFDTTTAVTAVLNIPAGRIQVIAADRTDATVEVRPNDPAPACTAPSRSTRRAA
ncbi:hypothetical protein GCM10010109_38010 [Actinoplanes campanulatus]|nr:hypothetical protein GCM10010109_38010 [Actinoplanes campanulatus]GID34660.1 hypothetical protein Aca09nite_11660 [Actinoplanes campanulatus]